jgi:hypothetical protein
MFQVRDEVIFGLMGSKALFEIISKILKDSFSKILLVLARLL